MKYRTVGLASNVMQAMGLKVTQLPGGEIIPAMEKGVIEAFEYDDPTSDRRFGAADVAKVYMLSSYHQASECLEIEFNKTKFNSLAKEQQAILRHAVEAASSKNLGSPRPVCEGPANAKFTRITSRSTGRRSPSSKRNWTHGIR